MNSPLSTPPRPASVKRLSLNLSSAPRPLHLVDANTPLKSTRQLQDPATAPVNAHLSTEDIPEGTPTSSPKPVNKFRTNPRRQSSISYLPRDRISDRDPTVRSPLNSPRYSSTQSRPVSVGPRSCSPFSTPRDRRSGAFEVNGPPLTLAEKHSELLHFIAQKESKCLELRSQLAIHESELFELKRRWERIIVQGFETPNSDGTSSQGQGSGAMLEGIREGVQGVSRFIAAGLSIGELSPPPISTSPLPTLRRTHSVSQSNSSISTNTTKSTRFSQSSASSIGEELPSSKEGTRDLNLSKDDDDSVQVLIVRDTGATPTMSPNPAFVHKQQQREYERAAVLAPRSTHSSFETEPDCLPSSSMNKGANLHRRKSRDYSNTINLTLPLDDLLSSADLASSSRSVFPSVELQRDATKAKRATMSGSAFPPMSSIPGLGSLAVGATSPPVVSSWVGTVGRKWEELQRGSTFSKSQKRASLLLSDMSQSIASAISLSSPPLSSASTSASTSTSVSTPSTPPAAPSYFSPLAASPIIASTTSASLLDNDDDIIPSSIMKPDLKPQPMPVMQPRRPLARPKTGTQASGAHTKALDEEGWNW